jgi:hypothetical protein
VLKKILHWSLVCFAVFCLGFVTYKVYQQISYDRQLKFFCDNIQEAVNSLYKSDADFSRAEARAKESLNAMALHTNNSLQKKGIADMRDALEDLRLCHLNHQLSGDFYKSDYEAWKLRSSIAFGELQPAY